MRGYVRDVNTNNIIKDFTAEMTGHIIQGILKVQSETHRIKYAAGSGCHGTRPDRPDGTSRNIGVKVFGPAASIRSGRPALAMRQLRRLEFSRFECRLARNQSQFAGG